MIKMLALAALAALVTACAAPSPGAADPMSTSRGSTPAGAAKAAALGFHGPLHRVETFDGPN